MTSSLQHAADVTTSLVTDLTEGVKHRVEDLIDLRPARRRPARLRPGVGLVTLGLAVAVLGWLWWSRRRRSSALDASPAPWSTAARPEPRAAADAAAGA